MMHIRTVTVELLRAGPRHNQLLSPLTLYLGVCGDAPAGRVTLPYEHRDMEQRLADLNYRVVAEGDPQRREMALDRTGDEIAGILSLVPGLAGALNCETERSDTLTQLRIVLSASELAMLPFEVSKVLDGAGSSGTWLALQSRSPVCITRHIRSTSAEGMRWPSDPRVLFIAGPDTPGDAHREALERALAPYRDAHDSVANRLVVVEQATLAVIATAVERAALQGKPFSHVHVLAHGDELTANDRYSAIGLALHDRVVSGKDLATALTSMTDDGVTRPAVVTLATCNSADVRDVRTPDASVAHDLHDQGIPLVVASQFPLSVEGSLPFVERFYSGQLRGEHPLLSLYHVRLLLRSRTSQDTHDWAAIVVYEAFPSDLREQLDDLSYWQARRAQEGALARAEAFVAQGEVSKQPFAKVTVGEASASPDSREAAYAMRVADAGDTGERLPKEGPYALECGGLRAAGYKRLAEVALRMAVLPSTAESWRRQLLDEFLRRIDQSRAEYWRVTKAFLGPTAELTRRKANLHWFLGQVLSLDVVRGRPLDPDFWTAAHLAARVDTDSAKELERAWACVSLSELALMRLADATLAASERAATAEQALAQATRIVELLGRGSEQVMTTSRQFERYVTLWGNPALAPVFETLGIPARPHWHDEHGLVPTARRIIECLRGPAAVPARPLGGNDGGQPATTDVAAKAATVPPLKPSRRAPGAASPRRSGQASASTRVFNIEMLPARNGDCLWIEYGDAATPRRMLIDCGSDAVADIVAPRLAGSANPLELFVLTHIDADHIGGVVRLFADRSLDGRYRDIWFNGWQQVSRFLGVKQGEQFSTILGDRERHLPWNCSFGEGNGHAPLPAVIASAQRLPTFDLADGMRITLLSPGPAQLERLGRLWKEALLELEPRRAMLGRRPPPPAITDFTKFDLEALAATPTKKDPSAPNGSSIAILAEYAGHAVLLTGDAHADVLVESIRQLQRDRDAEGRKLKLDAVKLSHHGSAHGTTVGLLDQIECPRYLVSSNGDIFGHPDREAIARVIVRGGERPTLCFNYRSALNAIWDERALRDRYRYDAVYPEPGQEGIRVRIAD